MEEGPVAPYSSDRVEILHRFLVLVSDIQIKKKEGRRAQSVKRSDQKRNVARGQGGGTRDDDGKGGDVWGSVGRRGKRTRLMRA